MTFLIILLVVILALGVAFVFWARSRRQGGIIATPPRKSRRRDGGL